MDEKPSREKRRLDSGFLLVVFTLLTVYHVNDHIVKLHFYQNAILAVLLILAGENILRGVKDVLSRID